MTRNIGIDLHRNNFVVATRAENGRTYGRTWKMEEIGRFARPLRPDDRLAVKMTTNPRFFYDAIRPAVKEVQVVNTAPFKATAKSVKKSDRRDAESLALPLEKDMLPTVRLKEVEQGPWAGRVSTRDTRVKQRTTRKNKIDLFGNPDRAFNSGTEGRQRVEKGGGRRFSQPRKASRDVESTPETGFRRDLINNRFAMYGRSIQREMLSSEKGLAAVEAEPFDALVRIEVAALAAPIRALNASVRELESAIDAAAEKHKGYRSLTSIKGVGTVSAATLLTVIGDVDDFEDAEKWGPIWG